VTSQPIQKYLDLIRSYIDRKISTKEFEREYLLMFKGDKEGVSEKAFLILDRLFSDVDCYTDILPLGKWDISEEQLREAAKKAYLTLGKGE